jgi:hypothetical protein
VAIYTPPCAIHPTAERFGDAPCQRHCCPNPWPSAQQWQPLKHGVRRKRMLFV